MFEELPKKKIMRTVLIAAIGIVVFPMGASAQSIETPGAKPAWVMVNDSLVVGLELTDDQRLALREVENRYQRGFEAVTSNHALTEVETRSRLDALDVERERAIEGVMTPEQYANWQRITAQTEKPGKHF